MGTEATRLQGLGACLPQGPGVSDPLLGLQYWGSSISHHYVISLLSLFPFCLKASWAKLFVKDNMNK